MATTTVKKRRNGPLNPQSLLIQQLAGHWNTLSGEQKNDWEWLTQQISNPMQPGLPTRSNGFATFVGLNSNLLNSGNAVLLTAPAQPDVPPALPPVNFYVTNTGGTLAITLDAPAAVTVPLLVYGAAPLLSNRRVYDTTQFKLLGVVDGLSGSSPTDITDLYTAQFAVPGAGYQIAVRLVGVTTHGFRSPFQQLTATTPAAAAAGLRLKAA